MFDPFLALPRLITDRLITDTNKSPKLLLTCWPFFVYIDKMDRHQLALDLRICAEVRPWLVDLLVAVGVGSTLDVEGFALEEGYPPVCSSVFLVGDRPQGSYDTRVSSGLSITVRNGSLSAVRTARGLIPIADLSRAYEQIRKKSERTCPGQSIVGACAAT